jgi:hypothetical protein
MIILCRSECLGTPHILLYGGSFHPQVAFDTLINLMALNQFLALLPTGRKICQLLFAKKKKKNAVVRKRFK